MIPVIHQLLDTFDGFGNAAMPAAPRWGFASTPSLQQAQQQHDTSPGGHSDVQTGYIHQLERDHAFISNHCVAAMSQQLAISQYTDNLSGTLLSPLLPDAAATDAALQSIREHVDGAWSKEAVWRGVVYAKSGDYEQAMECYDKALMLNPDNCDAYVARGAAHANQKHFSAALHDFRTALKLDPENANAAKYMQATEQHAQVAAAAEQEEGDVEEPPSPAAAAGGGGRAEVATYNSRRAVAVEPTGIDDSQQKQQRRDRHESPESGRHQQRQQMLDRRGQQQLHKAPHGDDTEQQYRHERGRQQQGEQQQQQQQDRQHSYKYASRSRSPASRKRKRSRSSDSSSSSSSSSVSQSSSDNAGVARQGLKRPNIADIQEAIQVLRSEQQHKKRPKKDHHKRGSKKAKRRHKHGGHKHHKSKRKHKSKH